MRIQGAALGIAWRYRAFHMSRWLVGVGLAHQGQRLRTCAIRMCHVFGAVLLHNSSLRHLPAAITDVMFGCHCAQLLNYNTLEKAPEANQDRR